MKVSCTCTVNLNDTKVKEITFVSPQIRKLMFDNDFESTLNSNELCAWISFRSFVCGFLGMRKEENYRKMIQNLLQNYQKLGCWMSLKIHFLYSHLNFYSENIGIFRDEKGEWFYLNITKMQQQYQGRWDLGVSALLLLSPKGS
jgi:hypothetical protein